MHVINACFLELMKGAFEFSDHVFKVTCYPRMVRSLMVTILLGTDLYAACIIYSVMSKYLNVLTLEVVAYDSPLPICLADESRAIMIVGSLYGVIMSFEGLRYHKRFPESFE